MTLPTLFSKPTKARSTCRQGQTTVEYALVLAVISILSLAIFVALSQHVVLLFSSINNLLDTAQSSH